MSGKFWSVRVLSTQNIWQPGFLSEHWGRGHGGGAGQRWALWTWEVLSQQGRTGIVWARSGNGQLGFVFNPPNLAPRRDDIMPFHGMRLEGRGDQGLEGAAENITGKVGQGEQAGQTGD